MDVRCDRCETEYELDDGSVSDAGTSVQCTTCGYTFVVARRSLSQVHTAVTPAQGNAEPSGPAVPEWTLSTDDGKVHRFRDLNMLQKWIVERKASRTDRLSRAGGPWLALGEMDELTSFFKVVDEADRARAHHPVSSPSSSTRTTPAAPMPAVRSPSNRIDTAAADRTPVQSDGPTVPNLRLPDVRASGTAAPHGSDRTPGAGVRAAAGRHVAGNNPRTPPPTPIAATPALASGSGAIPSAIPKRIATEPSELPPEGRKPGKTDLVFSTDTTLPVDGDLSLPTSRTRNVLIAVALASAAAIGGILWSQQGAGKAASVATAPTPPSAKSEPGALEAPQPPTAPAAPSAKVDPPPADLPAAPNPTPAKAVTSAPAAGRASAPAGKLAARAPDGPASKTAAGNYDRLVSDADRLLERGQGGKAEKLYEQALNAKPSGVAALTGIAYVMLDKQRHFKAIDMFRRALSVQPTYGPALFGIAESYRGRGNLPQALAAYRQYLAISPSGSDAPAARRQLKDLESANAQAAAGKRDSAPNDE